MARHPDVQYVRYYTDGSAARKIAPVAPLHTIKLPKVKKQKRIVIHVDPIAIAGILMAAVMLVLMIVGVVQLRSAQAELTTMRSYVRQLRQENAQLEEAFSQGYDIEDVERTALALGLVPSEQVRHVTVKIPTAQEEESAPGAWEQFYIFLTGLFA